MKTFLQKNFPVSVLGLLCIPMIGAEQSSVSSDKQVPVIVGFQGVDAETLVARLDETVSLTAAQKIRISEIFKQQAEALAPLSFVDHSEIAKEWEYLQKVMEIRMAARAQVRALLTAEQQRKYDRTPQSRGGGLTMNPANRVARLDAEVGLTPDQKKLATEIYVEEAEGLLVFAPEDRPAKGREVRQATKELIRGLLMPEQREKQDAIQRAIAAQNAEEKAFVEQFLRTSNAIAARVGVVSALSSQSSTVEEVNAQFRRGKSSFKVTGSNRAEIFSVYWERILPATQVKVVKVEDNAGKTIQH